MRVSFGTRRGAFRTINIGLESRKIVVQRLGQRSLVGGARARRVVRDGPQHGEQLRAEPQDVPGAVPQPQVRGEERERAQGQPRAARKRRRVILSVSFFSRSRNDVGGQVGHQRLLGELEHALVHGLVGGALGPGRVVPREQRLVRELQERLHGLTAQMQVGVHQQRHERRQPARQHERLREASVLGVAQVRGHQERHLRARARVRAGRAGGRRSDQRGVQLGVLLGGPVDHLP